MRHLRDYYLIWSSIAASAGGLLHIATIFGGPFWYRLIGAAEPIVQMEDRGHSFPIVVCLAAAAMLFACASFAFSGLAFITLVMWRPQMMIGFYNGGRRQFSTDCHISHLSCRRYCLYTWRA